MERCEGYCLSSWLVNIVAGFHFFCTKTIVVPAQVPELVPTQVTKGVLPVTLNRGDYFMFGSLWCKFHTKFPIVSFHEFWSYKT